MKKPKYEKFFSIIELMPPLSAWPNRPEPYDMENDQVAKWIANNCDVSIDQACSIKSNIGHHKILFFNSHAKLWFGRAWLTTVSAKSLEVITNNQTTA